MYDEDAILCKYHIHGCNFPFVQNSNIIRSILATLSDKTEYFNELRQPRIISEPILIENKSTLYTTCAYEENTGDKLTCSISILPQVDQLPRMFTYLPLQRNFLVKLYFNNFPKK